MDPPPGDPSNPDVSRDQLIDTYVKTLAQVVGSEEKARKKIYSVSTRHYFAFGACISEELSFKLKGIPVALSVKTQEYVCLMHFPYVAGEPFINGKAVPYDPKYHKEWVRNNDRDNQRCPNLDRSSVRRDNMENFQNRDMPTRHHAQENMPLPPPSPSNGDPPTYQDHVKSPQTSDIPSFEQNCRQCGAPVHQVGNQDLQDSPDHRICDDNTDARMRDDNNNGCQRGRSDYQNGSAEAGQTTLHGANARPRQSGSEPGIQGQAVHRHYYCNVHYHYYY
ncbi:hypothetical protein HU200_038069 [Digitaria exilis]|uniref:MORF/ORRM1/DAG-like MORF domain-containing protein n=1 Tax=Digitaria exilis TaxID=1010633 RepID=A0A835EL09_9POAL|nr:hypothetical protein HU200_038069 [Digitaria exilis]